MCSPLTGTRSSNGRLRLSTCFIRSSFAGPGSARRTTAGGVRPDTLPGILPPNASRLGQRRSRRGDPRSPKVTPERFCVLQHGSRLDVLPEVDDGILTSVVIVVPQARRAKPPRLLYAALRGSCALGLASSSLRHTSRSDRPARRGAASRTNPAQTTTRRMPPEALLVPEHHPGCTRDDEAALDVSIQTA